MCEYCENVTKPGTVGKTYYDSGTSYCELAWFSDDPMPTLQIKSDGNWSCVMVPCCPICGRNLSGTCKLVETDCYSNPRETIHVLECSECGRTCEHVNGSYPRCPHCGKRVSA